MSTGLHGATTQKTILSLAFAAGDHCATLVSGMSSVECRFLSDVSANIAIAILRVNVELLGDFGGLI
jgi:hypothetical protein